MNIGWRADIHLHLAFLGCGCAMICFHALQHGFC